MRQIFYIAIGSLILFLGGCAPSMEQASSRDPTLFDKTTSVTRPIGGQTKPLDIFVKKPSVTIEPVKKFNDTGSLFNAGDERNFLFVSGRTAEVGRYLSVRVVSNRIDKEDGKSSGSSQDAATKDDEIDPELQELLKAIPSLEPSDPGSYALIKKLRVKVVHRYENGDALVAMNRSSANGDLRNHISVQARVPYDALATGDTISTGDLTEIEFVDSTGGESIERSSSGWEDEYTLRLSGFSEAKSRLAAELDDKRNRLKDVKDRLQNKINTLGNERRTMSKERQDFSEKRTEDKTKIDDLQASVEEKDKTIADQQDRIEELSAEEKPSDEKEGDSGDE